MVAIHPALKKKYIFNHGAIRQGKIMYLIYEKQ